MNHSAAFDAGHALGIVLFLIGILAIGVYFGNRLGKKRNEGTFVRWPVGVALAIDLVALVGQCSGPSQAQPVPRNDDVVVEQKAVGSSAGFPTQFDADFLKRFDQGVRAGVVDTLRQHGITIAPESVATSTEVVSLGERKVLKSKIVVPGRMFTYQFAGVSGDKIVSVSCISRTASPFIATGSECEQKAQKAFGS